MKNKVEVSDCSVRIVGTTGVDLVVSFYNNSDGSQQYQLSLCFGGFEHGCLPSIQAVSKDVIVITNNLDRGKFLYK